MLGSISFTNFPYSSVPSLAREDIKLPTIPDDFAAQIRADFDAGKQLSVVVLKACGIEQIISTKEDNAAA
jgi:hypothetical protein